jgi:hypothetical protein
VCSPRVPPSFFSRASHSGRILRSINQGIRIARPRAKAARGTLAKKSRDITFHPLRQIEEAAMFR